MTCEKTIRVVEKVLKGDVNPKVVAMLTGMGGRAKPLHGEEVFRVTKKTATDERTGEVIDWGLVGEPGEVKTEPVLALVEEGVIPVITPLGLGLDSRVHNINADTAAAAVARALKARKLAYLSDVPGLLRHADKPDTLISTLKVSEVRELVDLGVISGGMLPKVESGVEALRAGVGKVHMIDGRMQHSLLLEIFTDRGVGTQIVMDE